MTTKVLFTQSWTESEAGWGQRPDGVCVSSNYTLLKEYIQKLLEDMRECENKLYGNNTPPEYSYPDQEGIQVVQVSEEVFDKYDKDKVSWINSTRELKA